MKATGIVRRIDELGRIVVPKEIRRTLRIREGDPLEIYTDSSGAVIFKKYSVIGEMSQFAYSYADVLSRTLGLPVLISDRDHIIAVSGIPKREFAERRISKYTEDSMEAREIFSCYKEKSKKVYPVEGMENESALMYPIIAGGDVCGSVIVLKTEKPLPAETFAASVTKISAEFLGKQIED